MVVAGVVNGLTGFGFALVSVPLLLLVLDPPSVVAIALLLGTVNSAINALTSRRHIDRPLLWDLLLPAFVGMPVGALLLRVVDGGFLKLAAALLAVGFAVALGSRPPSATAPARPARAVAGLMSGMLATSVGLSGPPVVLTVAATRDDRHGSRATLAAYFALASPVGLTLLALAHAVPPQGWTLALLLLPGALAGRLLGAQILRRTPNRAFRVIVLLVTLATGLTGAASALVTLLGRA